MEYDNLIRKGSSLSKNREVISFDVGESVKHQLNEVISQTISACYNKNSELSQQSIINLECIIDNTNNSNKITFLTPKEDEEILQNSYFKTQEHIHPFFTINGEESLINYFPHSPHIVKKENTPKILDLQKISTTEESDINRKTQVIIFSPHQDDEVLGAGALISKLVNENINFKIIYMTSGKGGGNSEIRKKEAVEGIKVLGGNSENCVFYDFPFYSKEIRVISSEDYDLMRKILYEYNPCSIFICGDVFDPNFTHRRCYDIILHTLHNWNDQQNVNISDSNQELLIYKEIINTKNWPFKVLFYFSVWYWPKEDEVTHILYYDLDLYKKKICAMMEHTSQIKTKFMGADERPFYQRATHRDNWFGEKYGKEYCEIFYMINSN